jgi:hypothetical protein
MKLLTSAPIASGLPAACPLFSREIQVLLSLPEKGGGVYNVFI